jgi:hypothetical protein
MALWMYAFIKKTCTITQQEEQPTSSDTHAHWGGRILIKAMIQKHSCFLIYTFKHLMITKLAKKCGEKGFEVFPAMTTRMKNAIFQDVAPCRSCVNWHFRGTYRLHLKGRKICEWETSMKRWLALYGATSQKTAFFRQWKVESYVMCKTFKVNNF